MQAILPHDSHGAENPDGHGHSKHAVWCGLTALSGIYLFFIVERFVAMVTERKHSKNEMKVKVNILTDIFT